MFGSNLLERRNKTERIADQAWEHLVSAVAAAGDTARSAKRASAQLADTARAAKRNTAYIADEVSDRVGPAADEAWHRASAAFDALAGRRPPRPWTWIIGAGVIGAAIGWAAGTAARTALARADEHRATNEVEFVDADRPGNAASLNT
jgi:hypothetical protein